MKRHSLLLAALLALGGCVHAPALDTDLDEAVRRLSGSFDSGAQAAADARYFDIRLRMRRIWPERSDGHWLYVEQATAAAQAKPYRQRIYRVARAADGRIVSEVYTLPDAEAWAGLADDPVALARRAGALQPSALSERKGCAVWLKRAADGDFDGGTEGQGCASELRGAAWASSRVRLKADRMETWDQGFDAEGRQVWGATAGPYIFVRRAP